MNAGTTVILSAGGTGGHLYPAEALAEELLVRGITVGIMTDRRGAAFQSLKARVSITPVRAATLKPGIVRTIKAVADMALGVAQALIFLARLRPALVVGFGGYPSFPGVFAAQMLGIPTIIHEQNAVLGKANRWLAARAIAIATSLPGTQGVRDARKVVITGNPVRARICTAREKPYMQPAGTFNILITGGSQAARALSDVVPEAIRLLPAGIKAQLSVIHQARVEDVPRVTDAYRSAGVTAEVKTFFDDMAERLSACHLFIGRSGASTVAEVAVVGRPAIFVPLWHADRQQFLNAERLAERGAAWVIAPDDFTPRRLADDIEQLAKTPGMLENAAAAAKACGDARAVKNLARLIEESLRIK